MFPFLLRGAHSKNLLKIDTFPFSNRTRNRTRTAAELYWGGWGGGHKAEEFPLVALGLENQIAQNRIF